jgi:hypothetical protein
MRRTILTGALIIGAFIGGQSTALSEDEVTRREYLRMVLPFYGQQAPSWCHEDQICWWGTVDDNRSDRELLQDLPQTPADEIPVR